MHFNYKDTNTNKNAIFNIQIINIRIEYFKGFCIQDDLEQIFPNIEPRIYNLNIYLFG